MEGSGSERMVGEERRARGPSSHFWLCHWTDHRMLFADIVNGFIAFCYTDYHIFVGWGCSKQFPLPCNTDIIHGLMTVAQCRYLFTLHNLLLSVNVVDNAVHIVQVKDHLELRLKMIVMISLSIHIMTSQDRICIQCVTNGL